jgi:hypothetical protein
MYAEAAMLKTREAGAAAAGLTEKRATRRRRALDQLCEYVPHRS